VKMHGPGSFENDEADNWRNEFLKDPSLETVEQTLKTIADSNQDERPAPSLIYQALAAAETVAALKGYPHTGLDEDLSAWAASECIPPDHPLVDVALRVVDRVCDDEEAAAVAYCPIEDIRESWLAEVVNLRCRLMA